MIEIDWLHPIVNVKMGISMYWNYLSMFVNPVLKDTLYVLQMFLRVVKEPTENL